MLLKIKEGLSRHPVQNAILFLLVVAVTFFGYKTLNQNKTGNSTSTENMVVLSGVPSDYYLTSPTEQGLKPTDKKTTSGSAKKSSVSLMDVLYNFTFNTPGNFATGIRIKSQPLSSKKNVVYAAEDNKYPVIYIAENSKRFPNETEINAKIIEVNALNNKWNQIVNEGTNYSISRIDFNEKQQTIAYVLTSKASFGENHLNHHQWIVKVYNLNNNKVETIFDKRVADVEIKWSPDGNTLAIAVAYDSATENMMTATSFIFYDVKSSTSKEYEFTNIEKKIYSAIEVMPFNWVDDSRGVLTTKSNPPEESIEFDASKIPVIIDRTNGSVQEINKKINSNQMMWSAFWIKDKIIGMTHPRERAVYEKAFDSTKGEFGWIFKYDTKTDKYTEYDQIIGKYMDSFLLDKQGVNLVYTVLTGLNKRDLYVCNLDDASVKKLNAPSSIYRVIGWYGNENNVLLWDYLNTFYSVNIKTGELTQLN